MGDVINFPGSEGVLNIRSAYELLTICVDYAFEHDQINEAEYLMLAEAVDTISPYNDDD